MADGSRTEATAHLGGAVAAGGAVVMYNATTTKAEGYNRGKQQPKTQTSNASEVKKKASAPTEKRVNSATLRKRWEKAKGESWPKEPGNAKQNQSVSHKKALKDGGTNDLDNIEPKPWKEHQQMHKENGDFKRWAKDRKTNK